MRDILHIGCVLGDDNFHPRVLQEYWVPGYPDTRGPNTWRVRSAIRTCDGYWQAGYYSRVHG